ncbi:hypothetical protein JW935_18835 [candidate division KSB1 bacterium]|nr:hypothetical protein [candidate division KSB1 bacterium]
MRKIMMTVFLMVMVTTLFAQRKGAISTGGALTFRTSSDADSSGSYLDVQWLMAYYLTHDLLMELEPTFRINFDAKQVDVSSMFVTNLGVRLLDMAPYYQYRDRQTRKRDFGVVAGVFASAGAGVWVDGFSQTGKPGLTYAGPVLAAGIGTYSGLSKFSLLRIKAQIVHLFPSGPVFNEPRTIFQVLIGFSVFVKM